MATPDIELARLKALDERRAQGADAWSPSRAREAVRKRVAERPFAGYSGSYQRFVLRDAENFLDSQGAFDTFCAAEFGVLLPL